MMRAVTALVVAGALCALTACPAPDAADAATATFDAATSDATAADAQRDATAADATGDASRDAGRDAGRDSSTAPDRVASDGASTDRTGIDAAGHDGSWYRPGVNTTWQWQLSGTINTSYDVDLYDIDLFETSSVFNGTLQAAGRRVLCYFSAGSAENWRPDYGQFASADLGNNLDGWPGERWVDVRSASVRTIMLARLDQAQNKGCDGVEPDNVDGYNNDPGIDYTLADQLAYIRFLAAAAHQRGLAIALKNDLDQAADLIDDVDLQVNEQCHQYHECDLLQPFISAGKPVLNAEYADNLSAAQNLASTLCPQALGENIRTLILPLDLDDSFRVSCD